MICKHEKTETVAERAYTGGVSSRDENRAAHGNICREENCLACGARRAVNVNGAHREEGPWGPSRAERREAARIAVEHSTRAVASVPELAVTCSDGRRMTLRVDAEGYIVATGAPHVDADVQAAARSQPTWLAAAQRARKSVLAALTATDQAR